VIKATVITLNEAVKGAITHDEPVIDIPAEAGEIGQ
jgi:hypothetical protein